MEALGQALQVVDQKNLEYMQRINRQETKEIQLQGEIETLNEEVGKVRADIDKLRKELEGDEAGRTKFERARGQLENSIEALEVQADTLKKALSTVERANEQLREETRSSADKRRETADKVYQLTDSLRLNQVELKKQEVENAAKDKKLLSLERQTQNLQAKIAHETDAKVLAEQERKEAEQESSTLKKSNMKVEEKITKSQHTQEKAEKASLEMNERVSQLQTQNAYLASRIDGQEEEKNTCKAEIRKVSERTKGLTAENAKYHDEIDRLQEKLAIVKSETEQIQKELEYIKREDVLDDAGRQRPIMIQSTESDLLEKLQINEFLFEAQQARNPIPPMIEKIAQMLAMLHDGQERADHYLGDLSKSNAHVSALRQRNMTLFTRTQMFESFKTRALLRYIMNLVEGDLMSDMHLDGLSFGQREINEMISLLQRYDATDKIYVISLVDNGLDDDSVNLILQLVFTLPYLRSLDIKRNCFTAPGIAKIEEQLRTMQGVTSIVTTAGSVLKVHSGNQIRLTVDVAEQIPKEQVAKDVDFTVQADLSHTDADPFLGSDGGTTAHPWTKTAAAQRSPQQPVSDPSAVELAKKSSAPVEQIGGVPFGRGGPGNLAALNRRTAKSQNRLPDPKKRQARRAKAAPVPELDHPSYPDPRQSLPPRDPRSSASRPLDPRTTLRPTERRASSMDRSASMPTLRKLRPVR